MVVSVVTRGVLDDANAFVVPIRFFRIGEASSRDKVGFEAQSPTSDGCAVTFEDIRFVPERLGDLRDGS